MRQPEQCRLRQRYLSRGAATAGDNEGKIKVSLEERFKRMLGIYGTQAFDNLTNPSLNPQSLPSTLPCNVDSFISWTGLSSPECGSGQEL